MKYILIITILIFTNLVSCNSKENEERGYIVAVGDTAPDFTMELANSDTVQLSKLRGKVVMLQFTASWCGVCRKEMPFIEEEIWQKNKDRNDFAIFGVDRDEPLETVKKFAKETGISYPLGLDPGADIFAHYANRNAGITRNVIIDREGKIIFLSRLFDREEFDEMKEVIQKELEKQ